MPQYGYKENLEKISVASSIELAEKYTKPASGIPENDLNDTLKASVVKANNSYAKPNTGIPASDLASGVINNSTIIIKKSDGTSIDSFTLNQSNNKDIDVNSATTLGNFAFQNCFNLASMNLPYINRVGVNTFFYCQSLIDINIPNVTVVDSNAFNYCFNLKNVNMADATTIGYSAFRCCYYLTNINISKVTSLSDFAFYYCNSLNVYVNKTAPIAIGSNTFGNSASSSTVVRAIYVPTASLSTYKSYTNWSLFGSNIFGYDF